THQILARFCHSVTYLVPAGRCPRRLPVSEARRELVILITDLHEEQSELRQILRDLFASGDELILVQLLGRREVSFSYRRRVLLEDLETGETIELDADRARDA